jgi:hypothetical protein
MPGTLITRLAWAVSVSLLTFVGLAPPSAAEAQTFPSCPNFDVRLEIQPARNRVDREFTDRDGNVVRVLSAGKGNTLTLTNDVTGERLVLTTGGSVAQITPNPDGTSTFVGTGHNVILFFPGDTPARRRTCTWVESFLPSTVTLCSRCEVLPARRPISAPHCLTEVSDSIAIAAEEPVSSFV